MNSSCRRPWGSSSLPQSSGQKSIVRGQSSPNSWPASSIGTPGEVNSTASPSRAFCSASSQRVRASSAPSTAASFARCRPLFPSLMYVAPARDFVFRAALVVAANVVNNLVCRAKTLALEAPEHRRHVLHFPLPGLEQAVLHPVVESAVPHRVDLRLPHQLRSRLCRVRAVDRPVFADQVAVGAGLARRPRNRRDAREGVEAVLLRLERIVLHAAQPVEPEPVDVVLLQPEADDVLHVIHGVSATSAPSRGRPTHSRGCCDGGGSRGSGLPASRPSAQTAVGTSCNRAGRARRG